MVKGWWGPIVYKFLGSCLFYINFFWPAVEPVFQRVLFFTRIERKTKEINKAECSTMSGGALGSGKGGMFVALPVWDSVVRDELRVRVLFIVIGWSYDGCCAVLCCAVLFCAVLYEYGTRGIYTFGGGGDWDCPGTGTCVRVDVCCVVFVPYIQGKECWFLYGTVRYSTSRKGWCCCQFFGKEGGGCSTAFF